MEYCMYFNRAMVLLICSVSSFMVAQPSKNMVLTTAIKTAKIIGYTAGIALPAKVLSYNYTIYKLNSATPTEKKVPFFIQRFVLDPIKKARTSYKEYQDNKDRVAIRDQHKEAYLKSYHEIFTNASLFACIGYSAHGLYTELKPVVKTSISFLQNKINGKK